MKIFEVNKRIQQSDSDCWSHWVEKEQISLHSTQEGAEKKIKSLLDKALAEIPKLKELNPGTPEESWEENIDLLNNNLSFFTYSLNGENFSKGSLYIINEILLED